MMKKHLFDLVKNTDEANHPEFMGEGSLNWWGETSEYFCWKEENA